MSKGIRRQQFYVVGQPGLDSSAERFVSNINTDPSTRGTVNKFIERLKSIGVWQVADRVCLFVGSSIANAQLCAKSLVSTTLVDAPTYAQTTGIVLDGTNDAIDTGITPSTSSFMTNNSHHIAWYCPSATPGVASAYVGSASNALTAINSISSTAGLIWTAALSDGVNLAVSGALGAGHGFGCAVRASSTSSFLYRNTTAVATNVVSNAGGLSTRPLHIGARDLSGVLGQFLSGSFGFFSCGGSLTTEQVVAFEIANKDFQRALGRYNEAA